MYLHVDNVYFAAALGAVVAKLQVQLTSTVRVTIGIVNAERGERLARVFVRTLFTRTIIVYKGNGRRFRTRLTRHTTGNYSIQSMGARSLGLRIASVYVNLEQNEYVHCYLHAAAYPKLERGVSEEEVQRFEDVTACPENNHCNAVE